MMRAPHPFAPFVRILGRGKSLTRSLTEAEAEEAMAMILNGDALPEQIGAFLMLLRLKEESPEEIAGFVRAARQRMKIPADAPRVDLDWSSYAGKRRQLPWFLIAALTLAGSGYRVFMHGGEGHTEGRVYTSTALAALGLAVSKDLAAAAAALAEHRFAYATLESMSPELGDMMGLRPILGLRSPVHTFARMLNPFNAFMRTSAGRRCSTIRVSKPTGRWTLPASARCGAATSRTPMPKPPSPARWRLR